MDLLLDRLIEGLNNGVIYALLALAMVTVFRGTGHLNIAQGEMAMFSAFCAYALLNVGLPVVAAIAIVLVGAAVGGAAVERLLVRPIEGRGEYSVLLVLLGLFLVLNAGAGVIWGGDPIAFPAAVPSGPDDFIALFDSRLRYQNLLVLGSLLIVLAVLYWMFHHTRLGLALRVSAHNPDSAVLLGVRVNRMSAIGWMIAGAVGALMGTLVAPSTTLTPGMMVNYLIYACIAATVGGFDSPAGAVVAGIGIGILENLLAGYVSWIGADLKQVFALTLLIVVLMVRPTGLFGSKRVERV